MSTNRIEKVNSLLEHEIGKIILKDFAFSPEILVTLTRVVSSSNLIEAKVYISVYPEEKAEGMSNEICISCFWKSIFASARIDDPPLLVIVSCMSTVFGG